MEKIKQLHELAKRQNRESELPDFILEKIININSGPEDIIDELLEKVEYFNSEAGLGCFSAGYSVADIEKALKKLT